MSKVYLDSGYVLSSMGFGVEEHMEALQKGRGGIGICSNRDFSPTDLPLSLLDWTWVENECGGPDRRLSRFEKLCILAARKALEGSPVDPGAGDCMLVLSTTKGNVELLAEGEVDPEKLSLWRSAQRISDSLGMKLRPLVISNACISGVVALLEARRAILNGKCRHALVLGADVVNRFVVSGFQSFLSLSDAPCRPYDLDRDGLSLGEAAAATVLSSEYGDMVLEGGAVTNDANHISGPSRRGEGLFRAIKSCLPVGEAPGLISAHGTATPYNDEMEAIALDRAGLSEIPANSLKGYLGHTLGAAGIVESLLNLEALRRNRLIPTLGYGEHGVSRPMNLSRESGTLRADSLLKLASGFGGSNAAALFRKRT